MAINESKLRLAGGSELVDHLGHSMNNAKDAAGNALHQATDAAGNVVHQATDAAGRTIHGASEALKSVTHQASDAVGQLAHGAADLAGRAATQTSETASTFAHGAHDVSMGAIHGAEDAATYLARGARTRAGRVERQFETTLANNPLALGAAAVAIGALIGYVLPSTEAEDRLMGRSATSASTRRKGRQDDATGLVEKLAAKSIANAANAKDIFGSGPKSEGANAKEA